MNVLDDLKQFQVEEQMLLSVRDVIERAHKAYVISERVNWVREWPGQVVICVSSMYWTSDVHEQLNKGELKSVIKYHESLQKQLNETVALVRCTHKL